MPLSSHIRAGRSYDGQRKNTCWKGVGRYVQVGRSHVLRCLPLDTRWWGNGGRYAFQLCEQSPAFLQTIIETGLWTVTLDLLLLSQRHRSKRWKIFWPPCDAHSFPTLALTTTIVRFSSCRCFLYRFLFRWWWTVPREVCQRAIITRRLKWVGECCYSNTSPFDICE